MGWEDSNLVCRQKPKNGVTCILQYMSMRHESKQVPASVEFRPFPIKFSSAERCTRKIISGEEEEEVEVMVTFSPVFLNSGVSATAHLTLVSLSSHVSAMAHLSLMSEDISELYTEDDAVALEFV